MQQGLQAGSSWPSGLAVSDGWGSCRVWLRRLSVALLGVWVGLCRPGASHADTGGVVRLSVEKPGQSEAKPEVEVQVKLKTKRKAQTRALVKFEARYFDRDVHIKDAYIDHKLSPYTRLRIGIDKKALGLEYEEPSKLRLTLHRSSVYQTLETLGLVGRQLQVSLRIKPNVARHGSYADLRLGMDGSRNANLLGSLRHVAGSLGFGGWGLLERHRIEHTYLMLWATVASAWLDTGWFRAVSEFFAGVNAEATEFERGFGDGHQVVFYGPRSELAVRFVVTSRFALEPFLQGALLAHDARRPAQGYRAQALAGLNLRGKRLVFRTNAELVTEVNAAQPLQSTGLQRRTTYHASLAYAF